MFKGVDKVLANFMVSDFLPLEADQIGGCCDGSWRSLADAGGRFGGCGGLWRRWSMDG